MKNLKIGSFIVAGLLIASCSKEAKKSNSDENEREIKISELPAAVVKAIDAQFPGAELKEADEITKDDGTFTYDVEIKHESKKFEVMYDSRGTYLGMEADDDDDHDGEHEDDDDNDDDGN